MSLLYSMHSRVEGAKVVDWDVRANSDYVMKFAKYVWIVWINIYY